MNVILAALIVMFTGAAVNAEQRPQDRGDYPPDLPAAKTEVYKTIGGVKLRLYIFYPDGHRESDGRSAILFFFGGGWQKGSPAQFQQHCKHFASLGMVAITADYRVESRHGAKVPDCIADAKSAVRWVRSHAERLGIDPNRITASGGSAGGHLAVSTALLPGFDEPAEDPSVSSIPNALVLFNPAVALAPVEGKRPGRGRDLPERLGGDPVAVSPIHHVRSGAPPTLIFHGKADELVPYWTVELFARKMAEQGNVCTLVGFEHQGHGFFNFGRGDGSAYRSTVDKTEKFLTKLGFLP